MKKSSSLRNKPCPCNSGQKYKRCCGNLVLREAQHLEEQAKWLEERKARIAEEDAASEARRKANRDAILVNPSVFSTLIASVLSGGYKTL